MDRESGCCRRATSGWVLVKFLVWKRAILRKVKEINGLLTSYRLVRDPKNGLTPKLRKRAVCSPAHAGLLNR